MKRQTGEQWGWGVVAAQGSQEEAALQTDWAVDLAIWGHTGFSERAALEPLVEAEASWKPVLGLEGRERSGRVGSAFLGALEAREVLRVGFGDDPNSGLVLCPLRFK